MTTFYDFEAKKLNGETMSMKEYPRKGMRELKTTRIGLCTPQYEGLEKLYQQYKNQGLVILGFPCNQFANQEAGTSDEIEEFCQINYGVSFPLFEKIEVNGANTHPIFKFLKSSISNGLFGSKIKWNFTKFIINSQGIPIKRFAPTTQPEKMGKTIRQLLQK